MTRYVLDIDDSQWKADHLPRVLRTTESVWLNELACQVEIQIVDARPLIVLDLDENDARHLVSYLEITVERHPDQLGTVGRAVYTNVAAQIEAQTKPARIPEPGLWGVVRASLPDDTTVSSWVHIRGHRWYTEHHGCAAWDVLVYPTLERDGVES